MHQVFFLTENSHCEANRKIFRRKIGLITIPLDKKIYTLERVGFPASITSGKLSPANLSPSLTVTKGFMT